MVQVSQIQHGKSPIHDAPIHVIGAGVAGSWHALLLAKAGYRVTLHVRGDAAMASGTSHWAGGMLAPYCEQDGSEPVITKTPEGAWSHVVWQAAQPYLQTLETAER